MDDKVRVKKDIKLFENNLKILIKKNILYNNKIVELATQYYNDSIYYYGKKDYFTSFGCINYAHGLLDSIINF